MELVDKPIVWSPQQEAIFHWGRTETGSAVVIARAGTGKTTSMVELVRWLRGQTVAMAFNKSAGEDLKKKFAKAGFDFKKAQAGTVHSLSFSALKKAYPELNRRDAVSAYKVEDLIDASGDEYALAYKKMIIKAVGLAKQRALGILRPIESKEAWLELITHFDVLSDLDDDEDKKFNLDLFVEACQRILKANNKKLDVVDFDDMCYLPILLKCRFWQFDRRLDSLPSATSPPWPRSKIRLKRCAPLSISASLKTRSW
jgi:DNA helicase-2/ATP-dependent DNA helicase PcrA